MARQIIISTHRLLHGVRRYEAGVIKPGLDVILSILDNIDVDANYLLGRTNSPTALKGA